jgi:O-acetyl-ADP-ribose deacetylase (regulator of RNase III)
MSIVEEQGDLFDLDDTWALAHCVGEDLIMGKGIAVEFDKRYGNKDWLLAQKKKVGEVILMKNTMAEKNIFYMVTKQYSKKSKPTYADIEKCLIDMFDQAVKSNIKKIGMPKIGCGLDGKDWTEVKKLIVKHKPADVEINVRYI